MTKQDPELPFSARIYKLGSFKELSLLLSLRRRVRMKSWRRGHQEWEHNYMSEGHQVQFRLALERQEGVVLAPMRAHRPSLD